MALPDYYSILGVPKNATQEEIEEAFRLMALVWHPDRFQTNAKLRKFAEEKFKEVNEANQTLSDPKKRKAYDKTLEEEAIPLPQISIHPTRLDFGSLLEGQKKSLEFTIENKGGLPAVINIDWEGGRPAWGELIIEPDEEKTFPIKVTIEIDTNHTSSGPKQGKILVDVDGQILAVEILAKVEGRITASAPAGAFSPPPPTPPGPTPMHTPPPPPRTVQHKGIVIVSAVVIFSCLILLAASYEIEKSQTSRLTALARNETSQYWSGQRETSTASKNATEEKRALDEAARRATADHFIYVDVPEIQQLVKVENVKLLTNEEVMWNDCGNRSTSLIKCRDLCCISFYLVNHSSQSVYITAQGAFGEATGKFPITWGGLPGELPPGRRLKIYHFLNYTGGSGKPEDICDIEIRMSEEFNPDTTWYICPYTGKITTYKERYPR